MNSMHLSSTDSFFEANIILVTFCITIDKQFKMKENNFSEAFDLSFLLFG